MERSSEIEEESCDAVVAGHSWGGRLDVHRDHLGCHPNGSSKA